MNEIIEINGVGTIRLTWNNMTTPTAYQIKGRKNNNGNPGPWKYWTVNTTYRNFQGLVSGNTYQWTVQSICGSGNSNYASPIRQINYTASGKTNPNIPDPFDAENIASLSNFTVYPNPAKSQVNLNFVSNIEDSNVTISIFDIVGKQIFEQTQTSFLGSNQANLNISDLQEGCYFIQIDNGQERIIEKLTVL